MKKLSLGFLVLMSLILASCGGDNKSGDSNRGTYYDPLRSGQVQDVVGYIHFGQANIFNATMGNSGNYQNGYQYGYGVQQQIQFQILDQGGVMYQAFVRKFGQNGQAGNQQYPVTIRGYFSSNGMMGGQVQVQSATFH